MNEKLEYYLRITGAFFLPEALDTTKSVKITCELDTFSVEKKDLEQDNEFKITYKGRVVGMPEITQGERKVKAKLKGGKSKTWRYLVEKSGEDYDAVMSYMIANFEDIMESLKRNL